MKSQRILIADDDEKVLALLTSSLQKSGYVTSQALNGVIALEQVKKERPDLILADIAMPEMDGFELCKIVREDPTMSNIPFVFLTAKGELNDRVKGLNLGADDYISKPFHITEVIARIKTILQREALMSEQTTGEEDEADLDLKGNLEQMSLAEVLQTLGMAQKTGELRITSGPKVGKISFDKGNIVQASLDKYKSEEAVYRILTWDEGYFEFNSTNRIDNATITVSTNSLLMEGFQQRDEYLKYKKVMPSFDSVLKLVNIEKAEETKAASQKVLVLINGERTIQEVINISPINYLLTLKILYTLLKKEIIEASEGLPAQERDYGQLAQELYE